MIQNINMKIEKSTDDTYLSNVVDLYVEKEEITNRIKYKIKGRYIKSKKKRKKKFKHHRKSGGKWICK